MTTLLDALVKGILDVDRRITKLFPKIPSGLATETDNWKDQY